MMPPVLVILFVGCLAFVAVACGDNFDRDTLLGVSFSDDAPVLDREVISDASDEAQNDLEESDRVSHPDEDGSASAVCGDGLVEAGEVCDGDAKECVQINAAYAGGWAECRNDCSGYDTAGCLGAEDSDTTIPDDTVATPRSMTVSVTTSTYGGQYAPRNVFAIWLEAADGTYIHSMGVWAQKYRSKLTRWYQKSGAGSLGMADAVTAASRMTHGTETVFLDFTKYPVAPGNYKVWFELNETNFSSKSTSSDISVGPGGEVKATNDTANIHDISITFMP